MSLLPISLVMLLAGVPMTPTPASIQGVVVTAETNIPVAHATVQLSLSQDDDSSAPGSKHNERQALPILATTDGSGEFAFKNVRPGNYRVTVRSINSNFVRISGDPSGAIPSALVTASAGESVDNLRLELTATASISGRIVDRQGKPLEGIAVTAVAPTYENGHRILSTPSMLSFPRSTRTNTRGEYRIDGISPGQYYLAANAIQTKTTLVRVPAWCSSWIGGITQFAGGGYGGGTVDSASSQSFSLNKPASRTFYPGVESPSEALPIDVHIGAMRDHMDFKIEDISDVGIPVLHGTVVDSSTGKRVKQATVWMTPVDGGGQSCRIDAKNGSFESAEVPPGKYVVSANLDDAPVQMAGRMTLDTANKPNNITISVTPLPQIRGHIVVEGEADASNFDLSRFSVTLQPDPVVDSARLTFAPVARDGTFEIAEVMGWDYRVSLRSPDSNTYIQSIRLGTKDILRGGLHLDLEHPPTADLEIVIRKNAGSVAGIAPKNADRQGRIQNVVLVPDPARRNRQDLYRTAQINENGEFEMRGLVPGDYQIFAWEHVTDGAWADPEFLRLYEKQGTPVRVMPGETAHATVNAIAPWK